MMHSARGKPQLIFLQALKASRRTRSSPTLRHMLTALHRVQRQALLLLRRVWLGARRKAQIPTGTRMVPFSRGFCVLVGVVDSYFASSIQRCHGMGKTATQALVSMAGARAIRQPHCTAFVMELQRQCLLALKRLPFVSNHYAWAPHAPRCPPRSLPNDHALRCPRLSELTSADVMQGATPTLSCCQTSRRCAPSLP